VAFVVPAPPLDDCAVRAALDIRWSVLAVAFVVPVPLLDDCAVREHRLVVLAGGLGRWRRRER